MAIDLDKLSSELEDALERARLLAEQRQQAQITPVHMLYVLLDGESALAAVLEKSGIACDALLESFSTRLNKEGTNKLEPGKRPVASRALRELIEKSFEGGRQSLASLKVPIESLVCITSMDDGKFVFSD